MIDEVYLSGYCRYADQSRMVSVEIDHEKGVFPDCNFLNCPYASGCTIGIEIEKLKAI